jgi:hypothetical protein
MANFLQQAALDIAATRYFTIAAVTVLLYDNCGWPVLYDHEKELTHHNCPVLTLGDEVELIWPAKVNSFGTYPFSPSD